MYNGRMCEVDTYDCCKPSVYTASISDTANVRKIRGSSSREVAFTLFFIFKNRFFFLFCFFLFIFQNEFSIKNIAPACLLLLLVTFICIPVHGCDICNLSFFLAKFVENIFFENIFSTNVEQKKTGHDTIQVYIRTWYSPTLRYKTAVPRRPLPVPRHFPTRTSRFGVRVPRELLSCVLCLLERPERSKPVGWWEKPRDSLEMLVFYG